jgi:hypothetical protein
MTHFRTPLNDHRATMKLVKLRALVADLHSQVHLLDQGIHDEEQRTGMFDVANFAYPILARTLRARRDNLLATIRVLRGRMTDSDHARLETDDVTRATQSPAMMPRT